MSLINDALRQARKAPPRNLPSSLPPLPPAPREPRSVLGWLLPALVVILIIAAIFFIGWAVASHSMQSIACAPPPPGSATQQDAAAISLPVVRPRPVDAPPAAPPPDAPKLQGIFYSPTSPSAIIDGKTVHPGDQFRDYKVKSISKYTVTLIGPDKKELQLSMGN
jgi:hypothetical protein